MILLRSCAAMVLGLALLVHTVGGFSLLGPQRIPEPIPVKLQLGDANGLFDGSHDWNDCAQKSLASWNTALASTHLGFRGLVDTPTPPVTFDTLNSIAFADNVFGLPLDPSLLSLTQSFASTLDGHDTLVEADIFLNLNQPFNCYRGSQLSELPVHDLQRTVTHALGHMLGLNHPDAVGQSVLALMNASSLDLDTLQHNDIQRALTLAGGTPIGFTFPPRDEALTFYKGLEDEYRDALQRTRTHEGHADAEGTAVWFPEWLRYVLNGCTASDATTRVLMQIRGEGIQPVCHEFVSDIIDFPSRNVSLDFLTELDAFYRDELQRQVELSYVDLEGKAVWLQEYLRYRLTGLTDDDARNQVFNQILDAAETESGGNAGTWNQRVTVEGIDIPLTWGTVQSSSRLQVSWSRDLTAAAWLIRAAHAEHVVRTTVDGAQDDVILAGLRSDSDYLVTVTRCEDTACLNGDSSAAVDSATARMIFQIASDEATYASAQPVVENGDTKGFGLYMGPESPEDVRDTVQLYYDANTPSQKGINVAISTTIPDSVTDVITFSQLDNVGLRRENSGDGQAVGPQTHQLVPLSNGSIRMYFEGVLWGEDGDRQGRLFSLDSVDGYKGQDFHPGTSDECTYEEISTGGTCEPTLVLGGESNGWSGIKEVRQSKLLYPIFNDWRWDESIGSIMLATIHLTPTAQSCSETFFNMGLASFNGNSWDLLYDESSGCPKILSGIQAPMPIHMGEGRYMIVFSDNREATMDMSTDKVLKVLYVDASASGDANLVEWEDFEDPLNARDVTVVWPDGTELTADEERVFDDYGIFSPTNSPESLVMYSNMSCGEGGECMPFIGQAGWVNP